MEPRTDRELSKAIIGELACCPMVDETLIVVRVTGGVVELSGSVPDLFQKYGAEDAVRRVRGVLAVANDIEVQVLASTSSDAEIAHAAIAAIRQQVSLCWEQIRPHVRHGIVTLEGAVDWIYQREEAEEAVRKVAGVICVINSIALAAPPKLAPRDSSDSQRECALTA